MRKYAVLDVETCREIEDSIVYDIGLIIGNDQGEILERHSYTVGEIYFGEPRDVRSAIYFKQNELWYKHAHQLGSSKIVEFLNIQEDIKRILQKHEILEVYAFNARFDIQGLQHTLSFVTGIDTNFFPEQITEHCIHRMCCHTIFNTDDYRNWCAQNNFFTEKGFFPTNVEKGYAYLTGNPSFHEEHIAVKDAEHEYYLLLAALKQDPKCPSNPADGSWCIPNLSKVGEWAWKKYNLQELLIEKDDQ